MKKYFLKFKKNTRGSMLLFVMIFGAISLSFIVLSVSSYGIFENRATTKKLNREMAFQIAESGINYYRWHLAHNNTDYQDGTDHAGPYVHEYKDKDGNIVGHFSLEIPTPPNGSTIVTINSTGWLDAQPNTKRIIKVRVGFPSLTDFALVSNADVWIGNGEVIHGKMHSNNGIRFDGTADAPITSAMATYTCKSHQGCGSGQAKNGVWGQGGPESYWKFPVPSQDFSAITVKLANIKDGAQDGGIYLSSSGQQGWHIQFVTDGTVNISKVNTTDCYKAKDVGSSKYFWPCIDLKTEGAVTSYSMPSSSYIFVEDNVWVDGVVNGRATIGTATGKSIIINDNIIYKLKDGNHTLGLIAEQNVLIPHNSPNVLEVDAAVLAQNGAAKRYYYAGDMKDSLTIYGAIITNKIWTWSWVSGGGAITSGYRNTNSTYDANLLYGPPPGFPVGAEYNILSWEEI
ncbi:MAG: hypothetical protein WCT11_04355 [Candidatus Magasanikbacteria bacterium]